MEFWLRKVTSKYLKKIKLRLSSHALPIETGIYNKENEREYCNCSDYLKNDFYFILVCPKYNDYRLRFIKKYYWEKLFNSENFTKLWNFRLFYILRMKLRNCLQDVD